MSAQSAKKKRFGSRRRVANQNEISKADEFHVTDSTFVAERHIPEEHTESLNVLDNDDNSQSETQHPTSPELSGGRRKLGSSRRNKGRHVKDFVTESYHKPREEVEDKTREKETTVTKQMLLAIQPERQEALSQGSEHDNMSATHDSFLYSATTPDYSSEVQNPTTTNYPEADLESLIPKGGNLQTDLAENEVDSEVVSDSCNLVETVQEGIDKSDILHSEEVKESAHLVGISERDQQLIDQSNFKEMPKEKLPNVCSVTEKEGEERDDNTESFRQDGNLQGNYLVSESHVESVVMPFSTTPEITTEKISPTENTEDECSFGQATISSPKEELPANEEQNEHFNLSEVRVDHHSEDAVNKQHEQEVKPTENQEMPQIDNSSESVIRDATDNSEIISGNLTDQTEVSDTYQSELTVKSTDGSPTNQDISNPDKKQDEQPTDENNFEALEQKNEDYHVYDTKEPQINDIERIDTTLGQVYEIEGRVEDDIKPSAEQTGPQEKDGLFSEVEESESSLNTVQSGIKAPLDSQLQQNDTSFNPIGNRRKLGSSRRNRGRQHVKDSAAESYQEHKEDVESTRGNEAFETAEMLLATERTSQEELSQGSEHDIIPATHESSLYSATMTDYSSEVQSPTTKNYPEADLESLIPESKNLQEDHDERETHIKVEVFDKSVGATLEGSDKSDTLQSQAVKGEHHSEDAVNKEHEQEVKPTENQERPQIDNSSESVIRDATENSEIISGNLTDQTEVSDTYQSDFTVKSTDGSPTNQDISNPDKKQDGHPRDENNFEALEHKNEDDHVYDTKEPQISEIERVDTALGQVYEIEGRVQDDIKPSAEQTAHQEKEGLFSEMEESESSLQTLQSGIKAPLDSQLQQNDTSFNPIGNRKKLGSSRRNRGRQHVKDSAAESYQEHKEDVESTRGNEAFETAQMLLATERTSQEALSQGSEHDDMSAKHDSFLYSATTPDYSSEVQNPTTTNYPEADLESLIPKGGNLKTDLDENEADSEVVSDSCNLVETVQEGIDKSDILHSEEVKESAAESYQEPTEDVIENTRDNEPLEITEISLTIETAVQEKSMETMLEGLDTFDTAQSEDVSDQVKENAHVGTQERDEDTESFRQDGNLQTNYLVSESHAKLEDIESSISPEVNSENSSPGEHTEIECSVEQETFSSSKEKFSTNEEQTEHVSLGARPLEGAVNKVHEDTIKLTQMQEMPQIDNFSIKDSESSLQTLQSEKLDSQPLDNSQSIKEQTHTGFSPTGNRRKLGSSRRHKGRLHVEDATKMSLAMETMRQEELKEQTDLNLKFAREIRSTVNNEENTEKMSEEDTILSQNLMDNCTVVTTDMTSSSGKDDFVKSNEEVNEEECKFIKETENLSRLGCDTVKMDLIQSLEISATARSIASDVLEQEEACQFQSIDALYCDKEINMQQTNDTPETVGDVMKQDNETELESSMYVQVYGLDEEGEQFEDTKKKDHKAHEMNVSPQITHAERFSAAHNKTDTLAPFDIGLEENIQAEPAVDVSEESGIFSQQGIQEQTNLDDGENLQGRAKQKRRKLGSTRRTQLNRKPEEKRVETKDLNAEADMRSLDKKEAVEEFTMTVTAEVSQNENAKPSLSPVDKEQQETISKALLPEQSASHNEEVVNPVKFVHVADVRDSERNMEPSQIDDFTATEMHITSVFTGRNSINLLLSANTEDSTNTGIIDRGFVSSCETTQRTQSDEERPASVNVTQDQTLKSAEVPVVVNLEIVKSAVIGGAGGEHVSAQASKQEPDDANEGAQNKHLEMKNGSPNLDSTNRRRKMGSSRRNLGSRTKREDLHQKQEVDDETTETETNVGDVKTESFSGNVEDEQQLRTEHKDSEQRKEKVSETVAYSHTDEENPVSHGQLVETEHQLTPNYLPSTPSTSPKHDSMSEAAPGGRRRKMGSHRRSHGHQNQENQTARGDRIKDNERDVRSITDECAIKTTEELRERSLGLDKISEVDKSDKKPSSNISTAKEGELSRPVSEKTTEPVTPVQRPYAEIVLGQESQHKFSLAGNSREAEFRSNTYNVMVVGDSCVGKTSFMKRAQSGKFSLDLPASVGLDSCMWTVVVDGKPVVLQLWDTAGQERFHSITRQIFHKAHAFLLMYDITSSQSFSAVSYWASCIQEGAAENVTILLVGNKSDRAERQVNTQKAEDLAKEYNFEFMECSAATGENVVQCLETVARMLSQKVDTREEALVLHKEPQQRKSGCC